MKTKQKIATHLWFDKEARDAAKFYTSLFKGSEITSSVKLSDTPSGSVDILTIALPGQEFTLMSAGPMFKINPTVSFMLSCNTKKEVEMFWSELLPGGEVLMAIDSYPWSERYGWIKDKFGVSWQIMFTGNKVIAQNIVPTMMFSGANLGKAEEAMNFYASVFDNSQINEISRYEKGEDPKAEGMVKYSSFTLEGKMFGAMDSSGMHDFAFNEATSFLVYCDDQEEIDYYWKKLSAVPKAEQCGWLKDKFGFSWQIVPRRMTELIQGGDKKKIARVTEAFLKMKKFDIATLEKAYAGK